MQQTVVLSRREKHPPEDHSFEQGDVADREFRGDDSRGMVIGHERLPHAAARSPSGSNRPGNFAAISERVRSSSNRVAAPDRRP